MAKVITLKLQSKLGYISIFILSAGMVAIRSIDLIEEILARDFHISRGGFSMYGKDAAALQLLIILLFAVPMLAALRKIYFMYAPGKDKPL